MGLGRVGALEGRAGGARPPENAWASQIYGKLMIPQTAGEEKTRRKKAEPASPNPHAGLITRARTHGGPTDPVIFFAGTGR